MNTSWNLPSTDNISFTITTQNFSPPSLLPFLYLSVSTSSRLTTGGNLFRVLPVLSSLSLVSSGRAGSQPLLSLIQKKTTAGALEAVKFDFECASKRNSWLYTTKLCVFCSVGYIQVQTLQFLTHQHRSCLSPSFIITTKLIEISFLHEYVYIVKFI